MTAAHRAPSFGTEVTVINHDNGRSAVVRINDRSPFVWGEVIDLSPATALALGLGGVAPLSPIVRGAENAPQKRKSGQELSFLWNSQGSQQLGGSLE
jgi:rare lipoprotein A